MTTGACRASSDPGCASTSSATRPSTIAIPSATTTGSSRCAQGDRIRIGKWTAPFDTVRRYLVTGQVDAGRNRALAHDAIVTAMTQLNRWGPDGDIFGDLPDWKAARAAVVEMMERYERGRRIATCTPQDTSHASSPARTRRKPVLVEDRARPSSWALASFEPALSPATR